MNILKMILVFNLLLTVICSGASIDLSKWQYTAPIVIEEKSQEYCVLMLTPEIYNVSKIDLADIRLINKDGNQIPYIFTRDQDRTETVNFNPSILNRSTDVEGNLLATLDFGSQTVKNCIEVETTGDNFRRAVKVEGSNDNVTFFTIVEKAYIFAINDKKQHRFNAIEMPDNDYRYIRITVSPMQVEETRPAIKNIKAFKIEKKTVNKQIMEMIQKEQTEDVNHRCSIYVYDLKFRRLPIAEIELNIDNGSFFRCVSVQGRDAATQKVKIDSEDNRLRFNEIEVPWNTITTDTLYRYTDFSGRKCERLSLPIGWSGTYRYIKIIINNYDDQPLIIRSGSAKLIPHKLIFPLAAGSTAKLYTGNESAGFPQYDLARVLTNPARVKTADAALAALIENPPAKKSQANQPWTEKHKGLMLLSLLIVVFTLGIFMLSSFRSIKRQDDSR